MLFCRYSIVRASEAKGQGNPIEPRGVYELDRASASLIPAGLIGRMLTREEVRKLIGLLERGMPARHQSAVLIERNVKLHDRPSNCRLLIRGVVHDTDEFRGVPRRVR